MKSYILDASVAAKWFLSPERENLFAESQMVFEEYVAGRVNLSVPDLFWSELGNILWKARRVGRMSTTGLEQSMKQVAHLSFPTMAARTLLDDAVSIATMFDRTVYDSIYVAMAAITNKPLLTADEKLANSLAGSFPIRWLGAFSG